MKKEIIFSFPAEAMQGSTEIFLLGDFNNWDISEAIRFEYAMDGFFRAIAMLEEGRTYNYRFLLDNGNWVNDHFAEAYVLNPELQVENCVITVSVSPIEEKKPAKKAKSVTSAEAKPAAKSKKSVESAPKKATVEAAPVKSTGTKKSATKAVKASTEEKKTPAAKKAEKPVKEAKKSASKGKK